jgi:hypothetical protein
MTQGEFLNNRRMNNPIDKVRLYMLAEKEKEIRESNMG